MRRFVPATALLLGLIGASAASAAPTIDLSRLPERCRSVAQIPTSARSADPAFGARVSAASCSADEALSKVPVSDSDATIQAMDAAAAPSLAMLDDVIAKGDSRWKFVAQYAKADLLFGMQSRVRSSIPPIGLDTPLDTARQIEQRHTVLEPKLTRWNTAATNALQSATDIARGDPEVVRSNPIIQTMLLRTQLELQPSPGVAPGVEPSRK
jgi:hypothetical protein